MSLLAGCASVDSQKEWAELKACAGNEDGLYWVQSECDELLVEELTLNEIEEEVNEASAIRLAMMRNQDLQSCFEEIGVGKADLVQAGLFKNPNLSVLFRFPFSGSGINVESDGLIAISELWQLPHRKKMAQANLDKILLKIADKVKRVKRDVAHSYVDSLFYQETQEYEKALESVWKGLRDEALLRKEWGYVREDEVCMDEIGYRDSQIRYEEYRLKADMAKNHLAMHLSLRAEDFEIGGNPPESYEPLNIPDIEEAVSRAFCRRLDIQAKYMKVCEKERLVELNRSMFFREVHTGAAYEHEADGANLLGPALDFEFPIFDQNQAQVARAQYELRQAKKELSSLRDEVRMHISDNVKTLKYLSYRLNLTEAEILPLQLKIKSFLNDWNHLMQINRYKVLESERDLLSRKIELKRINRDIKHALIDLEYNTGL